MSLRIFLFVVFSAYSPQTKENRRAGSQADKCIDLFPFEVGGAESDLSNAGKSSNNSERKQ